MLTVLITLNSIYGVLLTGATYLAHKEGNIKAALVAIGILALTIANTATLLSV